MADDTFVIPCQSCGNRFKIDIHLAGKEVWCPRCATKFTAPPPDEVPDTVRKTIAARAPEA